MIAAARLSTVIAAKGVLNANQNNWIAAQSEFQSAAKHLRDSIPEDYGSANGAWRLRNDLELYSHFYSWLGGKENLNFELFTQWPALVDDETLRGKLPSGLIQQINATVAEREAHGHKAEPYVDWLYVESLLPGAGTANSECSNWRRRSYSPQDFGNSLAKCTDGQILKSAEELWKFNSCFHNELEAKDWSVQYMTVGSADAEAAIKVIQNFVEDLMQGERLVQLGLSPEEILSAKSTMMSLGAYTLEGRDNLVRLVSDQGLSTSTRNKLEGILDRKEVSLPWNTRPLFRRPMHF